MPEKENPPFFKGLRSSLSLAAVLLIIDVVFLGDFVFCPVICLFWLLYAIVKVLFGKERMLGYKMMLVIAVTLCIALGNAWLQSRVARARAKAIIQAYEQYRAKNGVYPEGLYDLVPDYMQSVPRAKYALMFNQFYTLKGQHTLIWVATPLFGFPSYDFEKAQWGLVKSGRIQDKRLHLIAIRCGNCVFSGRALLVKSRTVSSRGTRGTLTISGHPA